MPLEKKDIEAVGEAIENLGETLEKKLAEISDKLNKLLKSGSTYENWFKILKQNLDDLTSEIAEIKERIEGLEDKISTY